MTKLKKSKDLVFGGAITLESVKTLNDRSIGGLTNTATNLVGIGIVGATANIASDLVSPRKRKKRKRK